MKKVAKFLGNLLVLISLIAYLEARVASHLLSNDTLSLIVEMGFKERFLPEINRTCLLYFNQSCQSISQLRELVCSKYNESKLAFRESLKEICNALNLTCNGNEKSVAMICLRVGEENDICQGLRSALKALEQMKTSCEKAIEYETAKAQAIDRLLDYNLTSNLRLRDVKELAFFAPYVTALLAVLGLSLLYVGYGNLKPMLKSLTITLLLLFILSTWLNTMLERAAPTLRSMFPELLDQFPKTTETLISVIKELAFENLRLSFYLFSVSLLAFLGTKAFEIRRRK